jgi:ABC-type proline/glycine betaine transport system permease subunit
MALRETFAEFILRIIPICIFSIVFCFINWTPINSFGMTMFWGLAVIIIYNMIVMNNLFKKEESK